MGADLVLTILPDGPDGLLLARSTVTVAGSAESAWGIFRQLPAALADQGFVPADAPRVGDDSAGYVSPDRLHGREVVYWTVVFRLGRVVAVTTVVGPPSTSTIADAAALASLTGSRITVALTPPATGEAPAAVVTGGEGTAGSAAGSPPATARPEDQPVASGGALPSQPTAVGNAIWGGPPDIGGGLRLGGLSGLAALDREGTSFIAITDRGPNQDIRVHGDKATAFLVPTYSPSIVTLAVEQGQLKIVQRVPLRLARGSDPVTGQPEVSGLPNSSRDEPAYDAAGRRQLSTDPNGVDPEGIAADPRDGTYWVCEEYGPSILHVALDGTILTRLVPTGLSLPGVGYEVKAVLPADLLERKQNRGLEGIAISPDGGTVFAIMQSPLSIPNERAGEASRNIRIVAIDVSGEPATAGVYLYRAEPYAAVGAHEQDDVKVGDLAAVTATRLLVTERDSGASAAHRKVYEIDLRGATDLNGRAFSKKALEAMSDDDLVKANLSPVAKRMLVDLTGLGFGHELVEGLSVIDDTTIAVVNDNNFAPIEPSELMLVRLPAALR